MHNENVSHYYFYDLKLLELKSLVPLEREAGGGRDNQSRTMGGTTLWEVLDRHGETERENSCFLQDAVRCVSQITI